MKQALKPKKPKADGDKRGGYAHDVRSLMIKDDDRGWIDVSLDIYDTNGDEEFATLQKDYYAKAHGGIVMYDLTKKSSFDNAELWVKENLRFSERNSQCVMFILGTNKDKVEKDSRKSCFSQESARHLNARSTHDETRRDMMKKYDALSGSRV